MNAANAKRLLICVDSHSAMMNTASFILPGSGVSGVKVRSTLSSAAVASFRPPIRFTPAEVASLCGSLPERTAIIGE